MGEKLVQYLNGNPHGVVVEPDDFEMLDISVHTGKEPKLVIDNELFLYQGNNLFYNKQQDVSATLLDKGQYFLVPRSAAQRMSELNEFGKDLNEGKIVYPSTVAGVSVAEELLKARRAGADSFFEE